MTALPAWLPEENWAAFVEMRKKTLKKPATDFALFLVLKELYSLKEAGHDPLACLNQSIVNGWADVYALKAKKSERQAVTEYAKTKASQHADSIEARGLTREQIAENARKVRQSLGRKPPTQGELH